MSMALTKGQIAVLHVAKTKLCLDDDTYRDILEAHGGARSAKSLDYKGFLAVMEHFKTCGFKKQRADDRRQRSGRERPGMATDGQIRKIKAVWLTLAGTYYVKGQEWRALRQFLKKRFGVDHENFLKPETAWKVIEAVKAISHREQGASPTL
jgi:phage gp16-like protein